MIEGKNIFNKSNIMIGLVIIGAIAMLITPLPKFVLDLLVIVSLVSTLMILFKSLVHVK